MTELKERIAKALLDHTPTWTGVHWDDDMDAEERRHTVREYLENTHIHDLTETIANDAAEAVIAAITDVDLCALIRERARTSS